MSRFLARSTSNRFARRQIRRRHGIARRGMMRDLPRESVPKDAVWYSENWRLFDDRPPEVRDGSYRIADTQLPTIATGISMFKSDSTITITDGYTLTDDNVGDYIVWPDGDGVSEYITAVNTGDNSATVPSSTTHDSTTSGKIRQEVNAAIWDSKHSKHVMLIGTKVYYCAWNVASWTEAYFVGTTAPANAKSVMRQKGDGLYLWNENGLYRIEMGATVPIVSRLNNSVLEPTIGDVNRTVDYNYGRRYTVTMVEREGNTLLAREDAGETIQESCPFAFNSDGRDYAEVWQEKPFGPGNETYGVLTGGTLDSSRDTPAEWESITDGQVKFTANDETHNIEVDFSGVVTFADVTDRIQVALRDVWPNAVFEFELDSSGNKRFKFVMPNAGDTVQACTAGTAGTDISGATYLNMTSTNGVVGNPVVNSPHEFEISSFYKCGTVGLSDARKGAALLAFDNKLWLMGGSNDDGDTLYNDVHYSEDGGKTWTQKTGSANWSARYFFAACVFDGKMWVLGGSDGSTLLNDAWYSTDGETWTQATADGGASGTGDTWSARWSFGAVAHKDKLFIAGGWLDLSLPDRSSAVYYTTDGANWTEATADAGWEPMDGITLVSAYLPYANPLGGDALYIVGGRYESGGQTVYSDPVWYSLSDDGSSWSMLSNDAGYGDRSNCSVVSVNETNYILNGFNENKNIYVSDDGGFNSLEKRSETPWPDPSYMLAVVLDGAIYVTRGDAVWKATPSRLRVPCSTSDGTHTYSTEYTHYRIWGNLDIGPDGINPETGEGNNPEAFYHVKDVPVVKAFYISWSSGVVTATYGTFHEYDVGSILRVDDGSTQGRITEYISSTKVKWSHMGTGGADGAAIGTQKFSHAQHTAPNELRITNAEYNFGLNDVGKRVFLADGTSHIITSYIKLSDGILSYPTEIDSTTDIMGYVITGALTGAYWSACAMVEDSTSELDNRNTREFYDTTTDEVLRVRASRYWLKNRFWEPLPNCERGTIIPGFMISGALDGSEIYMTDLSEPHLAGYYYSRGGWQVNEVDDAIKALRTYGSNAVAFCVNSTIIWDGEVIGVEETPEVAERIRFLSQRRVLHGSGVIDGLSIVETPTEGVDVVVSTLGEVRMFNGESYGDNLARNMMNSKVKALQLLGAASCDARAGYYRWSTGGAKTNSRVPYPDVCYNFAIDRSHGAFGGISITGSDWIQPPDGINGYTIVDGNGYERQVVWDNLEGRLYEISTYDGPTGSGLSKRFTDRATASGDGTEISASLWLGGDQGELPHYDIRHETTLLSLMPYNPSSGYRSGLEVDLSMYRRGDNWQTAYATAEDVTKDGDITFDETPRDKAHQLKIAVNRSEVVLGEAINYYTAIDEAAVPSKRENSESDYQLALIQNLAVWLTRNPSLYRNMVTGTSINGTPVPVTGVDGKSNSAFQISGNLAITGASAGGTGVIIFWHNGSISVQDNQGGTISLTEYGTHNGWTLSYVTGAIWVDFITLVPTGTVKIEDLRVYDSWDFDAGDLPTIAYLYNDMVNNNGANTLPIW